MGKHNEKPLPENGEWEKMSPQEKADWFDRNLPKRERKSQIYKEKGKHKKG